ncbi:MAG: FAD-dependent monooxygenase, partial [Mycolicibacterium aromaticivorans]|nr:FAD-dependent monooxygenase [Mycolicibacterium aromaticivorans]
GMNTGIQDAHNLAWKLALLVRGTAADGLLASYDAERRPVGDEVVGRTVRHARQGIGTGETDLDHVVRREAQLLIDYADSPIVGAPDGTGVQPGGRAPDATGLTRPAVTDPVRLFTLLDRRRHTALIYAGAGSTATDVPSFEELAAAAVEAAHGQLDVYLVAAPGADVADTVLPLIRDSAGEFAARYQPGRCAAFVIRPDGYLCFTARDTTPGAGLARTLKLTFR